MIAVAKVKDLYHHKDRFQNWLEKIKKKKKIKGLKESYSDLVIKYIQDMAIGLNISSQSKKGARSPVRLNNLRQRLCFILKILQERKINNPSDIKPKDLHKLFDDMRNGTIKTRMGTAYKSTADYVKIFKAFWHWYQKTNRQKGKIIEDITTDLDISRDKPKFVYFTKEEADKIINAASYDLKPILALAFDSGMRVTELLNIKISDFSNDFKEVNIREETSKTFGRRIKLMLCSEQIKAYVEKLDLKLDDFLCRKNPPMINKELRKLSEKTLNPEQIKYKQLSLYDFRHSSCCFWLPKYKSENALKYRFGWKKSDMIHYYTEFLGMKDTINEEDMYVDVTKTELEKEIGKLKKEDRTQKETMAKVESKQNELYKQLKKLAIITKISYEAAIKNEDIRAELKKTAKKMMLKGEFVYPFTDNKS